MTDARVAVHEEGTTHLYPREAIAAAEDDESVESYCGQSMYGGDFVAFVSLAALQAEHPDGLCGSCENIVAGE